MLILDVLSSVLLLSILLPSSRAVDFPEDTTSEFSVKLYHRLQAAGDQDNIIFSPLSVAVALGMVELGARGASLEEIRQAVGFSHLVPGEIHTGSPASGSALGDRKGGGSKMWIAFCKGNANVIKEVQFSTATSYISACANNWVFLCSFILPPSLLPRIGPN